MTLRVGVIGAGEVAQVIHLPTLSLLSHLYTVVHISDISLQTAAHCASKFHIPQHSSDPATIINDPTVDVIFVLTSDEYHAVWAVAALQAGKNVMIEKPLTLSLPAAHRILEAERNSRGRVFVGYMRRYAPSFTGAFLREVASIPKILHVRVRDMSGPNAFFVQQSGTFQSKTTDDIPPEASEARDRLLDGLYREAFSSHAKGEITHEMKQYCRFLGSLGSHDLSLMREALGPAAKIESVAGVSLHDPFYAAIFNVRCNDGGHAFSVTYESGIDGVPEFDAQLVVHGERKRVSITYDTPYVKGLPITVRVDEFNEHGEKQVRQVVSSYEDAYTAELVEMHGCFAEGKEIKTTAEDAVRELELYDMMYKKWLT